MIVEGKKPSEVYYGYGLGPNGERFPPPKKEEKACCAVRCPTGMEFCYMLDLISLVSSMVFSIDLALREPHIGGIIIACFLIIHAILIGANCDFRRALCVIIFRFVNFSAAVAFMAAPPMASFTANVTMPFVIAAMVFSIGVVLSTEHGNGSREREEENKQWGGCC